MTFSKVITTICRILVGVLFIISGLIKANDPLGFSYKLNEYFDVFGTPWFQPYSVGMSMLICIAEVFLGAALLVGAFRRFTLLMLVLLIVFFTFLTFYSAWFNKVTDCGCFGDALKLTPWQSFWKDIALLVMILIMYFNKKYINPIENRALRMGVAWGSLGLTTLFTFYCWYFLPVVDFRPYAIGKDIVKQMTIPPGAPRDSFDMTFIYEKGGKKYEFRQDELMKIKDLASYKYDTTMSVQVRVGYHPPIHDFGISTKDGKNVTDSFLQQKGYKLMIVHYDLSKSDFENQGEVNALAKRVQSSGKAALWPLTSSGSAVIESYRKQYGVPYDFYTADGTMLKTIIRANPGLVLLRDNEVRAMWPATAVPSWEEFVKQVK